MPEIRVVEAGSCLSTPGPGSFMADYDYTITPYGGRTLDCTYCYVPTLFYLRRLSATWGRTLEVRRNAPELLRRAAEAGKLAGKRIYLSPNTDPYVPQEREHRVTHRLLEVMVEHPPELLVIRTRAPWVTDDLELLRRLGRRVVVAISVTTDDDEVRKAFEPACPPIRRRVDSLAALHAAGVRTQASLSPLLPCNPDALADLVGPHCDWVVVQPFKRGGAGARTRKTALEIIDRAGWQAWLAGGPAVQRAMNRLRERLGPRYHEGQDGFSLRWLDGHGRPSRP